MRDRGYPVQRVDPGILFPLPALHRRFLRVLVCVELPRMNPARRDRAWTSRDRSVALRIHRVRHPLGQIVRETPVLSALRYRRQLIQKVVVIAGVVIARARVLRSSFPHVGQHTQGVVTQQALPSRAYAASRLGQGLLRPDVHNRLDRPVRVGR